MFGFFKKDHRHFLERGEKYLEQGRYVDAKFSFNVALEKVDTSTIQGRSDQAQLLAKISAINDALAELNIREAEYALNSGNREKAEEHLQIATELAEDVNLREKAEKLFYSIGEESHFDNLSNNNNACGSCNHSKASTHESVESSLHSESHLTSEEKFELAISTLPPPLPDRYAALGQEFACCYLSIHDGEDDKALPVLERLSSKSDNDIFCYELALIYYRQNDTGTCEDYLKRAIAINGQNPLCYLALVQLKIETNQFSEAIALLKQMIESGLLAGQAQIILGDVYLATGDETEAFDIFSAALSNPNIAREAAERLVPFLLKQNRSEEAEYLKKQYLKKCC